MSTDSSQDLPSLLARSRGQLLALIRKTAGPPLLRFESIDDLVQEVHAAALRVSDRFEVRSEPQFFSWLKKVTENVLSDRRDHWFAIKRGAARIVRLSRAATTAGVPALLDVPDEKTGPATFAERRDQLVMITRAIDLLPTRDRDLIRWSSEEVSITEQAERLSISYDAAERARRRAFERLRKTVRLVGGDASTGG